jgi:N,N-dimethylformamidase
MVGLWMRASGLPASAVHVANPLALQPRSDAPSLDILGYANRFSVRPGDTIEFKVSTAAARYSAAIVRLDGSASTVPPLVPTAVTGDYAGKVQPTPLGSCVIVHRVERLLRADGLSVQTWIWPTLFPTRSSGIVSILSADGRITYSLALNATRQVCWDVADNAARRQVVAPLRLLLRRWYFVAATFDRASGRLSLDVRTAAQRPSQPYDHSIVEKASDARWVVGSPSRIDVLVIGALSPPGSPRAANPDCFNGKIANVRLYSRPLAARERTRLAAGESVLEGLSAHWDFARHQHRNVVHDRGPLRLHGTALNARSKTSSHGTAVDFRICVVSHPSKRI